MVWTRQIPRDLAIFTTKYSPMDMVCTGPTDFGNQQRWAPRHITGQQHDQSGWLEQGPPVGGSSFQFDIFYNYSVNGGASWAGEANLTNDVGCSTLCPDDMKPELRPDDKMGASIFSGRPIETSDVLEPLLCDY